MDVWSAGSAVVGCPTQIRRAHAPLLLSTSALITLPSADSDRLILVASFKRSPAIDPGEEVRLGASWEEAIGWLQGGGKALLLLSTTGDEPNKQEHTE